MSLFPFLEALSVFEPISTLPDDRVFTIYSLDWCLHLALVVLALEAYRSSVAGGGETVQRHPSTLAFL